jgi:outer membrane lipoprotein-sorting protein
MRLVLLAITALPLFAQSGEEILARVDRLRHPWPVFTVELTLKAAGPAQQWKVSARENGDARLDGLSAKEKGRAVLLLGDQMWLLLPGSKRPLKVTPQQRLLGPAAGGDVARTRFLQDYTVQALAQESLEGRDCWRLELAARRPSLSARQVILWVVKEGVLPLRAEFHLASGKVARTAVFGAPVPFHGQSMLSGLVLEEPSGARAELVFSNWMRGGVDPGVFELPDSVR